MDFSEVKTSDLNWMKSISEGVLQKVFKNQLQSSLSSKVISNMDILDCLCEVLIHSQWLTYKQLSEYQYRCMFYFHQHILPSDSSFLFTTTFSQPQTTLQLWDNAHLSPKSISYVCWIITVSCWLHSDWHFFAAVIITHFYFLVVHKPLRLGPKQRDNVCVAWIGKLEFWFWEFTYMIYEE